MSSVSKYIDPRTGKPRTTKRGFPKGQKRVFISVADRYPELRNEFVADKNPMSFEEYSFSSNRKVWWRCSEGHEWEQTINNRTNQKSNCPTCKAGRGWAGARQHRHGPPRPGQSLADRFPALAAEWHPDNEKPASQVWPGTQRFGLWRCSEGHEWTTRVQSRTYLQTGCRQCWANGPKPKRKPPQAVAVHTPQQMSFEEEMRLTISNYVDQRLKTG